ncbi:hypothetical protein PENSPDRAFT_681724 [Peniophora sp. CONT]|nr:hypothetical protein PENSPDRAFT_681724 [Peniophora sp. CONT]
MSPCQNKGCPTLGWVYVTHVCRRWRVIAIGHRALWTTLHTEYFALWDVFLQRAGGLPLNIVELDVFRRISDDDLAKAIMPILPSAKSISLWSTERLPKDLGCLANCDLMEDLTLSTIYSAIRATSLPSFHANLRSLSLKSVLYEWNFRAVGLRKLEFVMLENPFPVDTMWRSCFMDVLDTLKEMPFLEQLNLSHVMPSPPAFIDTNQRIALPHLRELTLRGITSSCTTLWSLLDLPAETSITIDCCDTFMTAADLQLLSESLRARFTYASVPVYSEVVVVEIDSENRPSTLWLEVGHSDAYFGINKARRSTTLPLDTSIIRLMVPGFMDYLLD